MDKKIDLQKSVFEICTQYPEVKDILFRLGFTEITKPTAMQTAGRVMTLLNGAKIKGIDLKLIVDALQKAGFEVEGYVDRQALLKSYIRSVSRSDKTGKNRSGRTSGRGFATSPKGGYTDCHSRSSSFYVCLRKCLY